ncbi:MAG: methyltransferase [Bacteroidaceae bacterium]|nr:methyltransferase [Bacteroidaceae bacterium]
MLKPAFTFKQFAISQERCAMKVGTDGVLLGAWARVEHCRRILDMGTGTGLVALMAAQRSQADIVAIDLDADAVAQAAENVAASPWESRIQVVQADARQVESGKTFHFQLFDAILCNPPFFENSLKSPDVARTMARHTDTLSFDELARSAARLLSPEGELSVVIPYDRAHDMTVSAACCGLFATRQTVIVPVEGGKPKRILMAFSREGAAHTVETLCIHDAQRQYTPEYVRLVEAFYLKM